MPRPDLEKLITVSRRLALEAGDRIMEIYGAEDFEVRTKSDASPVTEADLAADVTGVSYVGRVLPGDTGTIDMTVTNNGNVPVAKPG